MDCQGCRREIEDAARGERLRAEEAALAHLESCASCRAFRAERDALRELVSSVGTVAAPPDFDWKLRARLAAEKRGNHRQYFRRGFAPGLPAIALAASFALLIAAAVHFKQAGTESLKPNTLVETVSVPATNEVAVADANSGRPVRSADGQSDGVATTNTPKSPEVNRLRGVRAIQVKSYRVAVGAPAPVTASNNTPARSNDFSSSAAPVITLFSVPVRTPTQPVKVLLDEGRGGLRTVALQAVTFGSQEILRRSSGGDAPSRPDQSAEEIW
jgi:hypothetical protein